MFDPSWSEIRGIHWRNYGFHFTAMSMTSWKMLASAQVSPRGELKILGVWPGSLPLPVAIRPQTRLPHERQVALRFETACQPFHSSADNPRESLDRGVVELAPQRQRDAVLLR